MKALWKMLARRYLKEWIEDNFGKYIPELKQLLANIGLAGSLADLAVGEFRKWLLQRAEKV